MEADADAGWGFGARAHEALRAERFCLFETRSMGRETSGSGDESMS